jgi:hypothetical protein
MSTEQQTRKDIIDKALESAGWNVNDPTQVTLEFDINVVLPPDISEPQTTYQGHQFSDYVLLGRDAKPLVVVEAKKTSKDAALGREQAKQYCYSLQQKNKGGELAKKLNPLVKFRELQNPGAGPVKLNLTNVQHNKERIEKRDLIQAPFTVIHLHGIRGIFSPSEINDILKLTEKLAA